MLEKQTINTSIILITLSIVTAFLLGMNYDDIQGTEKPTWADDLLQKNQSLPDRIKEEQIFVYGRETVIYGNYSWAKFTNSNSMFPTIDNNTNALQLPVTEETNIQLGDIISYELSNQDGLIHHRVISINSDEQGVYYTLKGDNNPVPDKEKVRREQIKKVTVALIY